MAWVVREGSNFLFAAALALYRGRAAQQDEQFIRAVNGIHHYIQQCDYFWICAPTAIHLDGGEKSRSGCPWNSCPQNLVYPPPPEKGPKMRKKVYKSVENLQTDTLSRGERPFVHTSVCSQFLEGLFAILAQCSILFEGLLIEIQGEIHHFAGWERGGLRGAKIVNQNFVNKLAFPIDGRENACLKTGHAIACRNTGI